MIYPSTSALSTRRNGLLTLSVWIWAVVLLPLGHQWRHRDDHTHSAQTSMDPRRLFEDEGPEDHPHDHADAEHHHHDHEDHGDGSLAHGDACLLLTAAILPPTLPVPVAPGRGWSQRRAPRPAVSQLGLARGPPARAG